MTKDGSMATGKRNRDFPVDLFGNPTTGELAHLVPNAPGRAVAFSDVSKRSIGRSDTLSNLQSIAQRIRWRVVDKTQLQYKRQKLSVLGSKPAEGRNKTEGSSLKHHIFNFIRLKTQGKHIDQHAAAMFVPCVTAQFIR